MASDFESRTDLGTEGTGIWTFSWLCCSRFAEQLITGYNRDCSVCCAKSVTLAISTVISKSTAGISFKSRRTIGMGEAIVATHQSVRPSVTLSDSQTFD